MSLHTFRRKWLLCLHRHLLRQVENHISSSLASISTFSHPPLGLHTIKTCWQPEPRGYLLKCKSDKAHLSACCTQHTIYHSVIYQMLWSSRWIPNIQAAVTGARFRRVWRTFCRSLVVEVTPVSIAAPQRDDFMTFFSPPLFRFYLQQSHFFQSTGRLFFFLPACRTEGESHKQQKLLLRLNYLRGQCSICMEST